MTMMKISDNNIETHIITNSSYKLTRIKPTLKLNKQILKDGCHFQRNPKIHIQVLMDLLDIRSILNSTKKITRPRLLII